VGVEGSVVSVEHWSIGILEYWSTYSVRQVLSAGDGSLIS
jgi:hypothetical protein